MNYPGDLRKAVIDQDSADDEGNDARFKRHNRFLRSLREDSLLMVDNFNVTDSQDQFVDVMLKFRCRILFTTCSRYEKHISLEAGDLKPDTLLELVGKLFPEAKKEKITEDIQHKGSCPCSKHDADKINSQKIYNLQEFCLKKWVEKIHYILWPD